MFTSPCGPDTYCVHTWVGGRLSGEGGLKQAGDGLSQSGYVCG